MAESPRRMRSWLFFLLPALLGSSAAAEGIRPEQASFKQHIAPLFARHCLGCHGETKPKGGVKLTGFADERISEKDRQRWKAVLENVEAGLMPPEGKPKLPPEESELIAGWIRLQLSKTDCGAAAPGRVTLRRLNRAEYNNTIRDLLGVDLRPADDFPSDDAGYGFDNIGDVLTLSPVLFEQYLASAEAIAEAAIVTSNSVSPGPSRDLLPKPYAFYANGEVTFSFDASREGDYRLLIRAFGKQAGPEPTRMDVKFGGGRPTLIDVAAVEAEPGTYEVRAHLEAGHRRVTVGFVNDYYRPNDPDPVKRGTSDLFVESIVIQGPADTAPSIPESHRRIIFGDPKGNSRLGTRAIVERLVSRAYRRPARDEEVERLVRLVDESLRAGDSFEQAIRLVLEAVLTSSHFLFHVEAKPAAREGGKAPNPGEIEVLGQFEMASRLSYFLWSSMPDDELLLLARQGRLQDDATLERQVRRMIHDPKAQAFRENFAGQWLQIRNLKTAAPDPMRFPAFNDALRAAMIAETEMYFESVLREDRSILDFLDSDYTFLNERLARHYGIANVSGDHFRRVVLEGFRRGGVLTHASVLTVTSNPTRTSPVKRGKYILEQFLGTPPPPPPPGAGDLSEEKEALLAGSLRQRMEKHRANPNCASCHAKMDPLGFGLENYNPVGVWRDFDGKFRIDATGSLPSGQSFRSPKELKTILLGMDDSFARCLSEKLLTYALGRGLDYRDRCAVDRIVAAAAKDNYKFSRLIVEVVKSDPFRKREESGMTHDR